MSAAAEQDAGADLPPADQALRPTEAGAVRRPADGRAHPLLERALEGRGWTLLRLAADTLLLILAALAARIGAPAAGVAFEGGLNEIWLFPPLTVAVLALRGGYRAGLHQSAIGWIAQVVGATSLTAMALLALETLANPVVSEAELVVRVWLFGTVYLAGGRLLLDIVRREAQAHRAVGKPTLIIGAGRVGTRVERRLQTHPEFGLLPVGYLDADPVSSELLPGRRAPVLGAPSDLPEVVEKTGARHVILAFSTEPDHVLVPLVRECERRGIEMSLVPRLFDSVNTRVELEHMGGLPLYALRSVDPRGWEFAAKYALDRVAAALLLPLLGPPMLLIAAAVKLTSPGPALYRQPRLGLDDREFDMLKFRTMRGDARSEGEADAGWAAQILEEVAAGPAPEPPAAAPQTDRRTPLGRVLRRFSLDELPQLLNVLKGDMSLVGPRPERPSYVRSFTEHVDRYGDRHRVKSGITGWAQVHGLRGQTSLADRVEWDNYYIENWSLWLDFRILLMTLAAPFAWKE